MAYSQAAFSDSSKEATVPGSSTKAQYNSTSNDDKEGMIHGTV